MSTFTITALNGVSYAFILFLLAAGFSLTFGVMGVINLAHGALYVLGAYFGLAIISQLDGFWLGVVVAAAGTGLVGSPCTTSSFVICTGRCRSRRSLPSA